LLFASRTPPKKSLDVLPIVPLLPLTPQSLFCFCFVYGERKVFFLLVDVPGLSDMGAFDP
jgi:hypothetical protein